MPPQAPPVTTGSLMNRLLHTKTFSRFLSRYGDEMKSPTLTEYLTQLCAEKHKTREQAIRQAELDRVYGHQIFSGLRQPTRDKVLQFAFGFELDVDQTQALLKIARKSPLYPRIKRDAAILYCLNKRMSVLDTQLMLSELGLVPLGKESVRE